MFWSQILSNPGWKMLDTGTLRIDAAERRITLSGKPIDLSPLLWRLLLLLAERPRRLVTRSELKLALWPYSARIDTERRLNTAVRALRAAFGDDAETPRFIETVRGGGYRWIAGNVRPRRAASAGVLGVACLAAMLLLNLSSQSARPVSPSPDLAAVLRAQSAVEEWRGAPTLAGLARAERHLDDALMRIGATPALLVLKAELELGGRWSWGSAERNYRRALKLEPAHGDARLGLAWLKVNRGERSEALRLASGLLTGTVLTGERRTDLGWLLIRAGRPDLAAIACGINPGASINRLSCAHSALAALGRFGEARTLAVQLMTQLRAAPSRIERVQDHPPASGYAEFLDWRVRNFLPADAPWFQRAQVLAEAGRRPEALDNLARAVAAHEPLAVKIASTPSFAILSAEPRFQSLTQAVGVPRRAES